MQRMRKSFGGLILFCVAIALAALPQHAALRSQQQSRPGMDMPQSGENEPVPAFHSQVPKEALPATMNPDQFSNPVVQNAYRVAALSKKVLYQQPCYCHCDRSQGHGSLLDCFVSKHGAGCNVCISESFYSYEQSKKGKTAAQIREGIKRGDWQSVDISKYEQPLPAKP
jgi:hypothetical protein